MGKILKFAATIMLMLCVFVFSGCGSKNDVSEITAVYTQSIGPEGGSIIADDGSFEFQVPSGALSEITEIKISVSSEKRNYDGYETNSPIFVFEPDGLVFNTPAVLTFNYEKWGAPANDIEEKLMDFYYIKKDKSLERAETTVDTEKKLVSVKIPHFSMGLLLRISLLAINSGIITNDAIINYVADQIEEILDELPNDEARLEFIQNNTALLEPFLEILEQVNPYSPLITDYKDQLIEAGIFGSSNANLSNIQLSAGILSSTFESATLTYNVVLNNNISSITIISTTEESHATVKVNNIAVISGSVSGSISINVGDNTIPITVTAQDGTVKTYTVVVKRLTYAQSNNNSDLESLQLSAGSLSPGFDVNTTAYNIELNYGIDSITITPTVAGVNSTVRVNGVLVASGIASGHIGLNVGDNTITVVVTAQNGTTKSYRIIIKRLSYSQSSNNADLADLTISAGSLSPGFDANTTAYNVEVDNNIDLIKVKPTVAGANSSVSVNGVSVTSGGASGSIGLNVGENTVTAIVAAQNGTTKTYTVIVKRLTYTQSSYNADLAGLTLSAGSLSPGFDANTTAYDVEVNNNNSLIRLTPTAAGTHASVKVNGVSVTSGADTGNISLNVGENTINIVVKAQDNTEKPYTIVIRRLSYAQSSNNADLADLTLSAGSLSPGFNVDTTEYNVEVNNNIDSITVSPTVAGTNASVRVNGVLVTSGAASGNINLNVGDNTITAVVTAQNGTIKTYTAVVRRLSYAQSSNNADLADLTVSHGSVSPVFDRNTTYYYLELNYRIASMTVTPTVSGTNASVKVNGVLVTSGAASDGINLDEGNNTITVVVTAQDGTVKSYTIVVKRPRPFIFTIDTSMNGVSGSNQFQFRTNGDLIIDWGDGDIQEFSSTELTLRSKSYTSSGVYDIKVYGHNIQIDQDVYENDPLKIIEIKQWGDIKWSSTSYMFRGCSFNYSTTETPDLTNVTDMSRMFSGAILPAGFNISNWNTGNVTNMSYMFQNVALPAGFSISNWDTGKVSDMSWMFQGATLPAGFSISNWNTENVITMSWMFYRVNFPAGFSISNWNINNVTNMTSMFSNVNIPAGFDISSWNTSNVTSMSNLFYYAKIPSGFNISNWDTGNVTSMQMMFSGATLPSDFNISNWNTGKVNYINYMFSRVTIPSGFNISNWNTSNVLWMSGIFEYAKLPAGFSISNWNTGSVTNMRGVFNGVILPAGFNISNWNTVNVTSMWEMFSGATLPSGFNISGWNTGNVSDMRWMFRAAQIPAGFNISGWNTGKVNDMSWMFLGVTIPAGFNISGWNISNVSSMSKMFQSATLPTGFSISSWNTGNVMLMDYMFQSAKFPSGFNISNWNTAAALSMDYMFNGVTLPSVFDLHLWRVSIIRTRPVNFGTFNGVNQREPLWRTN